MSTINGAIGHGVTLGTPGYYSPLTVTTSGSVFNNGTGSAIYGTTGTVVNEGRLSASGSSIFGKYSGIEIYGNGSAYNSGDIIAVSNGIAIYGVGSVTNSGMIAAQQWGVAGRSEFLYVSNTASIYGTDNGINLFSGGSVTNSGTIIGAEGVAISGAAGTVVNSGGVTGTYQNGIALSAGGSVTNSAGGVIYGGGPYTGVYITGGAGTIVNSGSINGYAGVVFSGSYNDTLIDSGTIIGRGGNAVVFGAGNDLLMLQPGDLLIQGVVDGGLGTNTLEFASTASIGTLTGDGADFVDFANGTVDAGAQWVLNGTVTFGSSVTLTTSGTLIDSGILSNDGSIAVGLGSHLYLAPGGYLLNDVGGRITGIVGHATGSEAPGLTGLAGGVSTVVNLGTIGDPQFNVGVKLLAGGSVTNGSPTDTTALLYGYFPILINGASGTVSNYGTLEANPTGGGSGVVLSAGGVVANGASGSTAGLIDGPADGINVTGGIGIVSNFGTVIGSAFGIDLGGGGTITDAGTIAGGGGTAVSFGGSNNLLVLQNGFAFTGAISAAGTGNVVELLGSSGAAVTADYNSLGLTGFQTVAFAPDIGNDATLVISSNVAVPGTIAGFTGPNDTIDLTGLTDTDHTASTSFNTLTNVLTVTGDNGSVALQLDSQDYTGIAWTAQPDSGNGTDITTLCFCAGTYIATQRGEVLVDQLCVGDLVLTCAGAVRSIAWVGNGRVLATRGRRNAATPVIVRKCAIAPNVPHRDLHVTKGHSLYLDGVLVPVEFLVNHRSILWDDHAQEVMLYHVELETHDVLLANGVPAESYRDDGNRWLFRNANAGWSQPPKPPCAPVLTGGPVVDAIWQRLLERSGPRPNQVLTDDPDLHLLVDGQRLDAEQRADSSYVFALPAAARSVRIASRAAAPAELGLAREPRVLGVALRRIALRVGSRFRIVDAADDQLVEGFHDYESDNHLRWTDGDAALPDDLFNDFAGRAELVLHVCGTMQYRADDRSDGAAA